MNKSIGLILPNVHVFFLPNSVYTWKWIRGGMSAWNKFLGLVIWGKIPCDHDMMFATCSIPSAKILWGIRTWIKVLRNSFFIVSAGLRSFWWQNILAHWFSQFVLGSHTAIEVSSLLYPIVRKNWMLKPVFVLKFFSIALQKQTIVGKWHQK